MGGTALIDQRFRANAADLLAGASDAGAEPRLDCLRDLSAQEVTVDPVVKSTAISEAGSMHRTVHEVERAPFPRGTCDRAVDGLSRVDDEIEGPTERAWGR
ncbi:hypothetical protein [Jannaschia sp. LMIT008]|uniref:hypothetical protein n=1 Tax=Jannaschia maritima TaxID=3032585 RepID=UPI0028114795|nr:hypothetical protein [Jannaschia sp. LMIT008]